MRICLNSECTCILKISDSITAAWCQIHDVPIEKIFSKTLVTKCRSKCFASTPCSPSRRSSVGYGSRAGLEILISLSSHCFGLTSIHVCFPLSRCISIEYMCTVTYLYIHSQNATFYLAGACNINNFIDVACHCQQLQSSK